MTPNIFTIDWFDGTTASVRFSDGPEDTPFSVPDCPLDSEEALLLHICEWWAQWKPLPTEEKRQELTKEHPFADLVGKFFEISE